MTPRVIILALVGFLLNFSLEGQKPAFNFRMSERDIKQAHELVLDEVFTEIRIIPLETSNSCFIGKIQSVKKTNDEIFVLSKNSGGGSSPELIVFNNNGDFERKIGRNGKGPGEYNKILDFCVAKSNGDIFVLDLEKINEYDMHGNFVKTYMIDTGDHSILPIKIERFPGNQFLIESTGSFQLGLFDKSGVLVKKFTSLNNKGIDLPCPFTFFQDHFLINMLFVDPVYTIDIKGNIKPYLSVDYGHLNLDIASYEEYSKKNFGQLPRDRVIRIFVAENNEKFIVKFSFQDEDYIGVLNKSDGTIQLYHIGNSNVCQTRIPNTIFQAESGEILFWADPSQFKEPFEKWMTAKQSNKTYKLISDRKVDESSNPVVIIAK
jgi:hypothetical protein